MGDDAEHLSMKMWGFPHLTWLSIIAIVGLLIGMTVMESTRESLLLSVGLAAVVVAIGAYRYRGGRVDQDPGLDDGAAVTVGPPAAS